MNIEDYKKDPVKFFQDFEEALAHPSKIHEQMLKRLFGEKMNIYYVNDREGKIGFLHVVASSRGSAKSHYLGYVTTGTLDFTTPVTVHILAHDVDLKEGVDTDFEWAKANGKYQEIITQGWVDE